MKYRELAKLVHPDVSGGSHERMSILNAVKRDRQAINKLARAWGFIKDNISDVDESKIIYTEAKEGKKLAEVGDVVSVVFKDVSLYGWVIDVVKSNKLDDVYSVRYSVYFPSDDNIVEIEKPLYVSGVHIKRPYIVTQFINQYKNRIKDDFI